MRPNSLIKEKYDACLIFLLTILFGMSLTANASQSVKLYAGQSTTVSCPDAPTGAIYQAVWASRHGSVSVTKDGTYGAKIKVTSYFTGTAQVQCDYYWRWYSGNTQHTNHATTYYNVTCEKVDIKMNQSGPATLDSGDGIQLSVTLSPSITPTPSVYWKSSNSNVAEVNQNGYVWAKQPGSAVISASSNAGPDNATIAVNVNAVSAERAEISPTTVNIVTDETRQLTLKTYPQYSKAVTTSWHSNNPSIVSVNSDGLITGKSLGETYIYCVVDGYINTNNVWVSVSKPKLTVSADKPSGLYEKGTTVSLSSNKSGATLYYTLDGTTPNRKSEVYTAPITLTRNTVLKVYAEKADCLDSDVLSIDYKVSSLAISDTYPQSASEVQRTNIVPTVIFDNSIRLLNQGEGISLKDENKYDIDGTVITTGNSLSFVPEQNLKEGHYTLYIPQQTIISSSEEENFAFSFSFGIKGSNIIADVRTGSQYSQVLKGDGTLWAWGRNDCGNIGNGTSGSRVSAPVKVLENISYIEAAKLTSAAINKSGDLYTWGYNNYGQLGNESLKDSPKPTYVTSGVEKVVTSGYHTLALFDSGSLYSWGHNWYGELGIGTKTQYAWSPRYVMNNVREVAASDYLTLIVTKDDELYTCGSGRNGELGNGHYTTYTSKPQKVMDNVKKVAALYNASLVLKNDGTVWSFGSNKYNQLGVQDDIEYSWQPLMIMSDVKDIDANYLTAAVIKDDNSLWLWGYNSDGQVGNGNKEKQKTPIKILDDVKKVSVGESHVLALTNDGELYGWGGNLFSVITDRTAGDYILTPTKCSFFPSPIVSKSLCLESLNLKVGEQGVLLPYISPSNADYMQIEWNSSNPEIASVTGFGVVYGVSEGKSTISCRIYNDADTYIEAECEVTISENGTEDGIKEIGGIGESYDQGEPLYYNLQGIRVERPEKGIYIKTQNGKSIKIRKP